MEYLMEHVLFEMENLSFRDWLRAIPFSAISEESYQN